jgi:hypothetical protein
MTALTYCAKQATAMAEFETDRAKQKLDAAIDAEESREEQIAARAQEIELRRVAEMAPIDVIAGMHSALEGAAGALIADRLLKGDLKSVGLCVQTLVHSYIRSDSEVMANDWMDRIDAELAKWGVQ